MRIGIDARLAYLPGIGRYVEELVVHLARIDNQNQYYVYYLESDSLRAGKCYHHHNLKERISAANFTLVHFPVPPFSLREHFQLARRLCRDEIDVFHSPWINVPLWRRGRQVVTIHDNGSREIIDSQTTLIHKAYYQIMTRHALRRADRVIVVSETLSGDLARDVPQYHDKMHVVLHGVSEDFRPVHEKAKQMAVQARYGIEGEYLLYVGTFKPHKNLCRLTNAFAMARRMSGSSSKLVIAARHDPRYPEALHLINKLGIGQDVQLIGWVDKADLAALYTGARMFLMPSLYESFGLPIVEAMACGTPVVT